LIASSLWPCSAASWPADVRGHRLGALAPSCFASRIERRQFARGGVDLPAQLRLPIRATVAKNASVCSREPAGTSSLSGRTQASMSGRMSTTCDA